MIASQPRSRSASKPHPLTEVPGGPPHGLSGLWGPSAVTCAKGWRAWHRERGLGSALGFLRTPPWKLLIEVSVIGGNLALCSCEFL